MAAPGKKIIEATAIAMQDVNTDVALPPSRARSFSFASMLADMELGDPPVSKTMLIENVDSVNLKETVSEFKEKLRNSVASSVSAAKRRVDSQYSVECGTMIADTGLYVVALVHRVQ